MLHADFYQDASIYQSNGLCYDFCLDDYAFSVLQDDSCWCSNYVPDKTVQVDSSECNAACPGYPSDLCGADGLWEYIALEKSPSGTTGASTSTQTSTPVSVPVFVFIPGISASSNHVVWVLFLCRIFGTAITTTGGLFV